MFALFLGTSFYAFRCPGMFNRYDNHLEYAKSELEILRHRAFAGDITKFIERRLEAYKSEVEYLHPAAVRRLQEATKEVQAVIADGQGDHVPENVLAPLLLSHWQFMNRAHPKSRVVIHILKVIQEITQYLRGWFGYFRLSTVKQPFDLLDQWIRRRLRKILWEQTRCT